MGHLVKGKITCYSTADGLVHDKVRALCEDHDGRIWVGTKGGGVSVISDGTIVNYTAEDGLPDNVVRWITEDRSGDLWIITEGGPALWKDGRLQPMPSDLDMSELYSMQMYEDASGVKWLATYGNGLDPLGERQGHDPGPEGRPVHRYHLRRDRGPPGPPVDALRQGRVRGGAQRHRPLPGGETWTASPT